VRIAEGAAQKVTIDEKDLAEILGPTKFENEVALRTAMRALPRARMDAGRRDILFIEASRTPGSGKTHSHGQLGDVMKNPRKRR